MTNATDTNQACKDELYERIEKLFDLRISSSGADIGIGFKTSRERSGSDRTWVDYEEWLELRQSIESLIRTEKLKLLAEVRERVVGENDYQPGNPAPDLVEHNQLVRDGLRFEQRVELNELEAEL